MADEEGPETPSTGFRGKGIGVDDTSIAFRPKNWEEIWNFAQLIAKTDFVPKAFQNNPGSILAAIQTGHELGLPPMASLQSIAVINGRPSVWGEGALALLKHDRNFEWIKELPPDQCEEQEYGECTIKMRGQPEVVRRFTKGMAERAKLLTKEGPWQTYRGRMYQMRSRAWAIRDAAPGALRGVGIREEAQDIEIEATGGELPIGLPQPLTQSGSVEELKARQAATVQEPTKAKGKGNGESRKPVVAAEPTTQTPDGVRERSGGTTEGPDAGGADARQSEKANGKDEQEKEPAKAAAGSTPEKQSEPSLKDQILTWMKGATTEELKSMDPEVCFIRKVFSDKKALAKMSEKERTEVLIAYKEEQAARP